MVSLFQIMYLIVFLSSVWVPWLRYRSIIHPHVIINIIMFVLVSDFIVRGADDPIFLSLDQGAVGLYLSIFLLFFLFLNLLMFLSPIKAISYEIGGENSPEMHHIAIIFSFVLLLSEILRRLYYVGGNPLDAVSFTFGPRFGRPWGQGGAVGGGNPFSSLIGILYPISPVLLGCVAATAVRQSFRLLAWAGWVVGVAMAFGDGSRSVFAIAVFIPLLVYVSSNVSISSKIFASILTLLLTGFAFSLIYSNRDLGISSLNVSDTSLVYHQDNSFYYVIKAADLSEASSERWSALPFFGASLLNFIPRAIWEEKPVLDESFFGSYKEYFVTISIFGEFCAIFGFYIGLSISVMFVFFVYKLSCYLYSRIENEFDLIFYFMFVYYGYMIVRSFQNVTMVIYLPILVVILNRIMKSMSARRVSSFRHSI